jgi:class 3 adenylate cyclase/tetratricopeptide (TPR) repeat protein
MPVCAQCSTENPDIAKFCLACGSPLDAGPPPIVDEERKLDTVLFVDMVGSTARAERLDPEDVLGLLEVYYERLSAVLERHGGTVEKYIGDAVVSHFGVPVAHEDDAERAVRAGFEILEAIEEMNVEDPDRDLHVRIGIATGEAIVTLGARAGEGKGISWGDILNTAARIEAAAPTMGILVGEQTYQASSHAIEYRPHEPLVAKGKSEPVPVWEAVRVKDEPRRATRDAPLIGRKDELGRLVALWEWTQAERRPGLATVVGAPGIGKSRLLHELFATVRQTGAVHRGRCLSYGEGITYWPVTEILKDAAGILQSDDKVAVSSKLDDLLVGLGIDDMDQLRTMAAAVSNLLGAQTTPRGTYSASEISQAELHWGLRRTFELLAAQRPLVLVFEDLHWAEPTLLELIEYLVAEEIATPLVVVASARPELEELRPSFFHEREGRLAIRLCPLGEQESQALLAELVGAGAPALAGRLQALLDKAGGNPLFLEETVRMLVEGGFLEEGADDAESLPVPTSIQSLIGSRLDGLPAQEKRVAQHASVAGSVFWSGAVAHLSGEDGELDRRLELLEQRDFVRAHEVSTVADEREWAFKHILTRDVAYGRLPKGRRISLHVRFGEWISALPGGEEEFVEIVAYHLEQACRLAREVGRSEVPPPIERAVEMLMRAAERAEQREGIREADRFYERALALVDAEEDKALELRFRRARLLAVLADHKAAERDLGPVLEAATARNLDRLRTECLLALANVERKQGKANDARARLVEASVISERIGAERLRLRAALENAGILGWFDGDIEAALSTQREAVLGADRLGERSLQVEARLRLGYQLFNAGRFGEAESALRETVELAEGLGSVRDAARAAACLALVVYYRDGCDPAEQEALRCADWLARTGDVYLQIQNFRNLAKCALKRGDYAAAERHMQDALPLALDAGGWLIVETYRYLVEAVLRQRRLDDALALLALARSALPEQEQYARAALLIAEGLCSAAVGEELATQEAFERSIEMLLELGLDADAAETRTMFAEILLERDADAGAAQLGEARKAFARIGAEAFLAEIDLQLASA